MDDLKHTDLSYLSVKPCRQLDSLVESVWMIKNNGVQSQQGVIVPDGKIDLFLVSGESDDFEIFSAGICTQPIIKPPFPRSTMFAVSFYPLAAQYIFKQSFADLKNKKQVLSENFWGFSKSDLEDFGYFYQKACTVISSLLPEEIDSRKVKLFETIRESRGEITVKELSERIHWSSREINRYFQKWYGITLKVYLDIIRFSNSLQQLKSGDLYPRLNYGDQSHFIRQVKKFSGVNPGMLKKNENDRFIQLSVLPEG
ncbi:AraC family transcriptional regulator [Chryseobacterium culicis]|uniref:AraC family transcriptional regulator n=1 Tax=Chryseobacterium culicis TaxID=680127 RepID=UPI002896B6E4|nr:AraC family transcriptional regulator [Chryseobacterium culicis]